tara:strand:+ start:1021 stop:1203 length:183 start_codon:yes stop_codon:yes gene_type:complete
MNERIQQLAEQVYGTQATEQEIKFAELIVRACAAEADKQTIYCRGIPWGRWIKEHFGVEP